MSDYCDKWGHFRCVNLTEECLPGENDDWKCPVCISRDDAVYASSLVGRFVSEEATRREISIDIELLKKENENLGRL